VKEPEVYSKPPAIVVGICGHGLAICRALWAGNVPVIALETDRSLPGIHTNCAKVEFVEDINGGGLIEALAALRSKLDCPGTPVLFLTNDRMVGQVGRGWNRLGDGYCLSWSHCREQLTGLLDKSYLESHCSRQGLLYPRTCLLESLVGVESVVSSIGYPMFVKPSRPLSRFKTAQPGNASELAELAKRYREDLPFIVQRFIPGDDRAIFFSALYLEKGHILARFDGHKLRSRPLGHTTIAESWPSDEVFDHAARFFSGLELSGPVSLELKRDDENKFWVIEPTVGRTDFWLGLCTANGVNLPLIEYCHQARLSLPLRKQCDRAIWFNEQRDPFGRIWFAARRGLNRNRRTAVYLFMSASDLKPGCSAFLKILLSLARSFKNRIASLLGFRRR
jgi:D-aspartate ligase